MARVPLASSLLLGGRRSALLFALHVQRRAVCARLPTTRTLFSHHPPTTKSINRNTIIVSRNPHLWRARWESGRPKKRTRCSFSGFERITLTGWPTQVEDEVTLGKIRAERISVPPEMLPVGAPSMTGPRTVRRSGADFIGRADYSAAEEFEMVAGAVRAVVVGGVKIKDGLTKTLGADGSSAEIHFVPGETGEITQSYRPSDLDARRIRVDEIERLFADLHEDVERAD